MNQNKMTSSDQDKNDQDHPYKALIMDPARRIFNVEGKQRTLDMPLVTPAQIAQKKSDGFIGKNSEEWANDAIQQVDKPETFGSQIINANRVGQPQQDTDGQLQETLTQIPGQLPMESDIQQPLSSMKNPEEEFKKATVKANNSHISDCSKNLDHRGHQNKFTEEIERVSFSEQIQVQPYKNQDEKPEFQNIDNIGLCEKPNQTTAPLQHTQKLNMDDVETSKFGQTEPLVE